VSTNESFVPSEAKCAKTLREIHGSENLYCVDCDSPAMVCRTTHYREHYQRYTCLGGCWLNDLSRTIFENSKIPMRYWFYKIRQLDIAQPTTAIAEAITFPYPATLSTRHR
jgi:hypothetical protein